MCHVFWSREVRLGALDHCWKQQIDRRRLVFRDKAFSSAVIVLSATWNWPTRAADAGGGLRSESSVSLALASQPRDLFTALNLVVYTPPHHPAQRAYAGRAAHPRVARGRARPLHCAWPWPAIPRVGGKVKQVRAHST